MVFNHIFIHMPFADLLTQSWKKADGVLRKETTNSKTHFRITHVCSAEDNKSIISNCPLTCTWRHGCTSIQKKRLLSALLKAPNLNVLTQVQFAGKN